MLTKRKVNLASPQFVIVFPHVLREGDFLGRAVVGERRVGVSSRGGNPA
jgi:hypothetical protein